jgi:hypothetical protein
MTGAVGGEGVGEGEGEEGGGGGKSSIFASSVAGGCVVMMMNVYCHTQIEKKLGNSKEQNFTFLERDHPLSTKPVLSSRHPQRRSLSSFSISVACFSSFSRSLFS